MRILGIDPGLIATGYGVLHVSTSGATECLAAGVIRPDSTALEVRLLYIHERITALLHEFIPDALALEDLYSTYAHPRTAILMGHARGVVYLAAAQRAVPVTSYAPTEVKKALTGRGRATKMQVEAMVRSLLVLPAKPVPDHMTDALALALCHAHRERAVTRIAAGRQSLNRRPS
jgi:crossover junction endodeoxyribonuclease RuvC